MRRSFSKLNLIPRLQPGHFRVRGRHFEKSCDKIIQPDCLTLVAIHSDERKKPREWAHLANAGEFNRPYLTCQISAILYADRVDRRKQSPSLYRAHLAIFADRRDRRIKSPGVSPALAELLYPAIRNNRPFCIH